LYNDTVKFGAVTAYQTIGSAQPDANGEALIPADGIVGVAGLEVSSFHVATPLFHTLCEQGKMSPCRFGITLGNTGKGTLLLGALDQALFMGDFSTTSIIQEWALYADIALNGNIIKKDALVELNTGTATVIG
jgi:pepsin A